MAAPTVTSISPSTGPTAGQQLVVITGTNFRMPPLPPATGPATTKPNPSVQVLFGTTPALRVRVLSSTLLHVTAPIRNKGPTNITVRNVDQFGVLIGAESAVVASAYTYARPQIDTPSVATESDLARLVRTLILEMQRQVFDNVVLTTHTDYDDTTGDQRNIAMLASLPGIVLSGPKLTENRFFSINQKRAREKTSDLFEQLRTPYTVDLTFTFIGTTDNTVSALNLMSVAQTFFNDNKVLRMLRDPSVPEDYVEYEMDVVPGSQPNLVSQANNSNIRAFSMMFIIRGFDIEPAALVEMETARAQDVLPTGFISGQPDGVGPQPSSVTFGGTVDPTTGLAVIPTGGPGPGPNAGTGLLEQLEPQE